MRVDNPASGHRSLFLGPEPNNEAEHFGLCPICGEAVDMRDLAQVYHHDRGQHDPIGPDA